MSATAGNFTLAAKSATYTVNVGATTTTFKEHGVSSPSFADVCVGDHAQAIGTLASTDVVTADEVVASAPHLPSVTGAVTAVNGNSAEGSCGVSATAGNFTLAAKGVTYTVSVGATTTTFKEHGATSPSFADVCVGDRAEASGTISTTEMMTATEVEAMPPPPDRVSGSVTAVNGAGVTGTCGVAGTAGDFTLTAKSATYTVNVGATTTTFKEHGVSSPSFADVCVGDRAEATGSLTTTDVLSATEVTATPPHPQTDSGTVAAVNGSSKAGTCGSAASTGEFTMTSGATTYTVDVGASSTAFKEHRVSTPTFADICVGDRVQTVGTVTTGSVVSATKVIVTSPSNRSTTTIGGRS